MATQNSTRIWENDSPPPNSVNAKPAQLPSITTLTNDFSTGPNGPASPAYSAHRSSDAFATPPQSTRSSALSGFNNHFYSSSVSSPHRASNSSALGGATSHPMEFNNQLGSAGAHQSSGFTSPRDSGLRDSGFSSQRDSSGFGPQRDSLGLPNINQQHTEYRSSHEFPSQESRRSSLGSQVNTPFNNMNLGNSVQSPYKQQNANQSQSSITASLQRERGIPPTSGIRNSGLSHNSHPQQSMSPLSPFPGESKASFSSRTAPVISSNPIKEVYHAEKPTIGQPYAFPDPDVSNRSSGSHEGGESHLSKRDSGHTSIGSSVFTTDTKLPAGQHRLDEDPMPGTHHHSLQHKQVSALASEADSPESNSPYSRTPALRNSHKMAERKRRTEMKQLFDALRAQIPASHGSKSSKWEILSKASEHIRNLEATVNRDNSFQTQMHQMQREIEMLRNENQNLYSNMEHYREQARPSTATTLHPQTPFAPPGSVDPSRSLPPLTNGVPASNSMQGIQYSEERR